MKETADRAFLGGILKGYTEGCLYGLAAAVVGGLCWEAGKNTANLRTRNTVLQELIDREFADKRTNYSHMEVLSIVGRAARPRWGDKQNQWADWVEWCEAPGRVTNWIIKGNYVRDPITNKIVYE